MLHNQKELYKHMDLQGLDYLIATTPENVFYLSDFASPNQSWLRGTFAGVVYPRDEAKKPILILSKSEAELLSTEREHTINDVRFYGAAFVNDDGRGGLCPWDTALRDLLQRPAFSSPVEAVKDALISLGFHSGQQVGVDERGVFSSMLTALDETMGQKLSPQYEVIAKARLIKTPEEVLRLQQAVRIAEQAARVSMELAREGMVEAEMAAIYHGELIRRGAKPFMTCLGFGSHGAHANAQPTDYIRLERNCPVRFDIGGQYRGYHADTAKIGVLGQLSREQEEIFSCLRRSIDGGIQKIAPGVASHVVFEAVMNEICQLLPDYRRTHVGHGIGVEMYDPPTIGQADWCFREGMVLCVEAPYYLVGAYGLQVEELVHVTADGVEVLSERPVDVICV